jgi:serine/threonine protein kinase
MQIEQLGPYRIGPKLGKGGMGSVYEATDAGTGQRVAVKALSPQLATAEGFRERFEAEIESLKKLQHEGIVRLYGYGEENGILFYSMELVEGPSLEQEINDGRRFDWNETLLIAIQICRALKHAHDHGVVHRDIKPANLLLSKKDHRVKIADFGIARLFGSTQLTTAGGILGTADYMSPEQVDGRPVTDRCDQYALGCVMFALLAGRPPFRAKTMPEMLQLQRFAEPDPVRRYAPQTPEQLDRLIRQLLSKDPAQRFPNVLVLGRHMEAMQRGLSRPAKSRDAEHREQDLATGDSDATTAPATDVTLAQSSEVLERLETADSDVYEAPTLADEAKPARAATQPPPKPARQPARTTAAPVVEKRFTVVDEQARRAEQDRAERWSLLVQLGGWAVLAGSLGAGVWWLTRPATADDLYDTIEAQSAESDDLRAIDEEIAEFLLRFPDDPRVPDVTALADELELQQLERRVRTQSRLRGGKAVHAAERVYAAAVALAASEPARAAKMLADLLALYPDPSDAEEGVKPFLVLAERKLAGLRASLDEQASEQLPQLEERLRTAQGMETVDMAKAAAMYRALVDLYEGEPWARPMVAKAHRRLHELSGEE